jgi:transcriptional regulator with XRE-family HTH domain
MLDGERIRQLRTHHALSQDALGRLIGKDGQYVSKLERGVRTCVTSETLEHVAEALACSTDYLLGRTDDPRLHQPARRRRTTAPVG